MSPTLASVPPRTSSRMPLLCDPAPCSAHAKLVQLSILENGYAVESYHIMCNLWFMKDKSHANVDEKEPYQTPTICCPETDDNHQTEIKIPYTRGKLKHEQWDWHMPFRISLYTTYHVFINFLIWVSCTIRI